MKQPFFFVVENISLIDNRYFKGIFVKDYPARDYFFTGPVQNATRFDNYQICELLIKSLKEKGITDLFQIHKIYGQ